MRVQAPDLEGNEVMNGQLLEVEVAGLTDLVGALKSRLAEVPFASTPYDGRSRPWSCLGCFKVAAALECPSRKQTRLTKEMSVDR